MSSERWAGFTDEDIERIKLNPNSSKSCPDKICEMEGDPPTSKSRGPMKIKMALSKSEQSERAGDCIQYDKIKNSESRAENEMTLSHEKRSNEDFGLTANEENCTCNSYMFEEESAGNIEEAYHEENDAKCETEECSTNLLPLEVFEMRQKRIEAENARRRALISKAINDKKMRTQAEAIKLAKITQELNRIDSSLSADVSILRNYIEKASLEFTDAEKRYLRAEKEFVEAKLLLFDKMQRKEMLTEHLCAIIEQNENRKADKLVELMKQLEMEVLLEDCEIGGISPILPNLCALNDEPYHTCQTLKPALSSNNSLDKSTSEISQTSECEENTANEIAQEMINDKSNITPESNNISTGLER